MENDKDKKKIVTESIGNKPVNSRIFINYNQTPPEVKFEYPDEGINQVRNNSATYLIAMTLAIIIMICLVIGWMYYLEYVFPNSQDADISFAKVINYSHLNESEILIQYIWLGKNQTTILRFQREGKYWYYPSFYDIQNKKRSLLLDLVPILIIYVLFFLLTFLFARLVGLIFYKTKWGHKSFPELNKRLHDKKYSAEFFKDDVVPSIIVKPIGKNPSPDSDKMMSIDKWTVELPMFQNMYMDYEASGDFSKYLTKISIIEHPFSKYVKKEGKEMKKGIRQLRREERLARKNKVEYESSKFDKYYNKKPNIYLWKCIFEFKQKPETGSIKLWFT